MHERKETSNGRAQLLTGKVNTFEKPSLDTCIVVWVNLYKRACATTRSCYVYVHVPVTDYLYVTLQNEGSGNQTLGSCILQLTKYPMREDNTVMDRGATPMTIPTMYVATLCFLACTM